MTPEGTKRSTAILVLFCIAMSAATIGGRSLTDRDETRVAGIAREMALEEQWSVPHLNGKLFLEYPPAGYWPLAGLLRAGAPASDLVAQLPIALAALAVLFLTFRMACRIAGVEAGWIAVVVLQCTAGFVALNRRVLVDPLLCFWITLALHGALFALSEPDRRGRHLAVFYAGIAGAFLSKGLVGIVLPAAVALVLLAVTRQLRLLPGLVLHPALAVFVAPIGIWLSGLAIAEGTPALDEVWRQSVFRAVSSSADHAHPPWFYFERILYLALPALLLVPHIARDALGPRGRRRAHLRGPFDLFGIVWFTTMLAVLSVASAKRNVYLGPFYPGLALAVASWWARSREQAPGEAPGRWLSRAAEARPPVHAAVLFALVAAYLGMNVAFEYPLSASQAPRPLFEDVIAIRSEEEDAAVVLVRPVESLAGAAVYYLGETVRVVDEPALFDAQTPGGAAVLVGEASDVESVLAMLPDSRRARARTRFVRGREYRIAAVRASGAPRASPR